MTNITLTRAGKVIGKVELFDVPRYMQYEVISMVYPQARTITKTNTEWRVDLGPSETPSAIK